MNSIENLRNRASLTQQELAFRLNVTQGAVSQWENGLSFPSTEKLSELAKILDCSIDELLA